MGLNFENWVKGTYQSCTDPTEWNGDNKKCELCEKDADMHDDYCEDHQRCVMCGDNDDCNCKEEWETKSNCCEAEMNVDTKMCKQCNDHCISAWDETNKLDG